MTTFVRPYYVSDGPELGSIDVEGQKEKTGMIPPLSGQKHKCRKR